MKETKTDEVIEDVKNYKSEVGVIALNDFNSGMLKGILSDCNLEFHELFRSSTHVYLHKAHPLAGREELSLEELREYPCVVYDQGDKTSFYYREEMLARYDYKKTIVSNDRASSADLLEGCGGYMIGTGILGGVISDDIAVIKLREQEELTLGYIVRKGYRASDMGKRYIQLLQEYSDKV